MDCPNKSKKLSLFLSLFKRPSNAPYCHGNVIEYTREQACVLFQVPLCIYSIDLTYRISDFSFYPSHSAQPRALKRVVINTTNKPLSWRGHSAFTIRCVWEEPGITSAPRITILTTSRNLLRLLCRLLENIYLHQSRLGQVKPFITPL